MWFLALWLFVSYIAAICAMFIDFEYYGDFVPVPQEKYEYGDASEIALRFLFCIIPILNLFIIALFLYAHTKPFKKLVLRKIKKMLEEADNE